MEFLPYRRTRYLLLFVSLLSILALIEAMADSVAGYGGFGFALILWACFGTAFGWLLVEPMIRPLILTRQNMHCNAECRVCRIAAALANASAMPCPRIHVYESTQFDVMFSGIGAGVTILVSSAAAALDDDKLRAVLAHEFGHIRLGHALIRLTLYGSLLSLAIFGQGMTGVILPANMVVLWAMRKMEYAADRDAVRVVGVDMTRAALEHVGAVLGDIPAWQSVFSTHPTFRNRIARLH